MSRESAWIKRLSLGFCVCACLVAGAVPQAFGDYISWTSWTSASRVKDSPESFYDPGYYDSISGSAFGTLKIGTSTVGVEYQGELLWAQINDTGFNYWSSAPSPYLSSVVGNAPSTADIVTLTGSRQGTPLTNTIRFSEPVRDPVMALMSLGRPALPDYGVLEIRIGYEFDQAFILLSSGQGFWGGDPNGSLVQLSPTFIEGLEGHGAIEFPGYVESISWEVIGYEDWHGFQIGVPVPEPSSLLLLSTALGSIALAGRWRRIKHRSSNTPN
jgi:hypothetical protein